MLGGEPTARSDILEIFSIFDEEKLNFGFNTNGLKLTNKEFRNSIIQNKTLKNIVFSLEGSTAEINDAIRGKKVFEMTTENLKEMIRLKKKLSRNDIIITVNFVVSKMNLINILDMIDFCIGLEVDELGLLQFIPIGNGKVNDQSISTDQTLELINEIADRYDDIKDKIKLIPKFTFPLARRYAKEVLQKDFPETFSTCGAGNVFFFINNKGQLFPCDRYKQQIFDLNEESEISLVNNKFWDIAGKNGFGDIFDKTESNLYYPLFIPCSECEFLRKSCYPCIAHLRNPDMINNVICKRMMDEINKVSANQTIKI